MPVADPSRPLDGPGPRGTAHRAGCAAVAARTAAPRLRPVGAHPRSGGRRRGRRLGQPVPAAARVGSRGRGVVELGRRRSGSGTADLHVDRRRGDDYSMRGRRHCVPPRPSSPRFSVDTTTERGEHDDSHAGHTMEAVAGADVPASRMALVPGRPQPPAGGVSAPLGAACRRRRLPSSATPRLDRRPGRGQPPDGRAWT